MRKRIIGFLGSKIIYSNFVVGVIAGILLSIILAISPDWNIYSFMMFIVWAVMLLLLDPIVNLGFILTFCPIIFVCEPKERIGVAISFFMFILINWLLNHKKAPR